MKHTLFKTFAAAAAALLLAGCNSGDDGTDDDASGDTGGDDPVYAEMSGWNACEVLDDLQPLADEMGIEGWGGANAEGGTPGNSELGNTLDPDALGCNGLISIGENEGMGGGGEVQVKIVPTEDEDQATAAYEDRVTSAETESAQWTDAQSEEFTGPWDQGTLVSWIGDAEQPYVEVVARDGQWVSHIVIYHTQDFGLRGGGEPSLAFTTEELHQWLVDTYLPQVNQIVNDKIAEVQ
ncbi:hypothetical protein [Glycomyces harbinensis]|uniref:Lipoprotein n=1 Tax=Glycomyces harbinensis TaxID=58114 RepID=A0A1G7CIV6_9ACTN|nr:hypothetical protein [Glycomyces harbinensis]SDE39282.1 hypothetical protein SAMN05216270_12012 [Glycomyces harbinensis]